MEEKTQKTIDLIATLLTLALKYGPKAWDMIKAALGLTDEDLDRAKAELMADPVKTADELLEDVKKGG